MNSDVYGYSKYHADLQRNTSSTFAADGPDASEAAKGLIETVRGQILDVGAQILETLYAPADRLHGWAHHKVTFAGEHPSLLNATYLQERVSAFHNNVRASDSGYTYLNWASCSWSGNDPCVSMTSPDQEFGKGVVTRFTNTATGSFEEGDISLSGLKDYIVGFIQGAPETKIGPVWEVDGCTRIVESSPLSKEAIKLQYCVKSKADLFGMYVCEQLSEVTGFDKDSKPLGIVRKWPAVCRAYLYHRPLKPSLVVLGKMDTKNPNKEMWHNVVMSPMAHQILIAAGVAGAGLSGYKTVAGIRSIDRNQPWSASAGKIARTAAWATATVGSAYVAFVGGMGLYKIGAAASR